MHTYLNTYIHIQPLSNQYPIGPPLIKVCIHTYIYIFKHTSALLEEFGRLTRPV